MKATHFFVGFGPTLWSRRRGETEYGVKAIPAGGFVKIVGMTPLEEVEPGDEDRAFWKQPAPAARRRAGRRLRRSTSSSRSCWWCCASLFIGQAVELNAGIGRGASRAASAAERRRTGCD